MLLESGETISAPRGDEHPSETWGQPATVTEVGREVLRDDRNRVELNGIDHWLGETTSTTRTRGAGTGRPASYAR